MSLPIYYRILYIDSEVDEKEGLHHLVQLLLCVIYNNYSSMFAIRGRNLFIKRLR